MVRNDLPNTTLPQRVAQMSRTTTEDFADLLDELALDGSLHAPFLAYVSNHYGDPDLVLGTAEEPSDAAHEAVQYFEEAYAGEWDSERAFAEDEDGGAVCLFDGLPADSVAERYFDWEMWTRDLFISDYWSAPSPGYGVYVFRNV